MGFRFTIFQFTTEWSFKGKFFVINVIEGWNVEVQLNFAIYPIATGEKLRISRHFYGYSAGSQPAAPEEVDLADEVPATGH